MDLRLGALRAQGVPVVVLEAAVLIEADWIAARGPGLGRDRVAGDRAGRGSSSATACTPEQAQARIDAQLSNDERTSHAQVVIENNGSLDELQARVKAAWETLVASQVEARAGGGSPS